MPLGVPIGVVSAVDERSRSLTAGEKCKGGGVSRESSFTTWLKVRKGAVYSSEKGAESV